MFLKNRVSSFRAIALFAFLVAGVQSSASTAAEDDENDLFQTAGGTREAVALEEVFGNSPATVFVPGRLYRNGQGALFINGQRFSSPTGVQDVAGFLSENGGYLIAIRANVVGYSEKQSNTPSVSPQQQPAKPRFSEEELQKLPPEMRLKALEMMGMGANASATADSSDVKFGSGKANATVFYRCASAKSCAIAHVVKGVPVLHITTDKIWFNDPARDQVAGNESRSMLLSYRGIDAKGELVDGPTGVMHAAPLPNGQWMIKRLDKVGVSDITFSWVTRSADGTDRVQYTDTDTTSSKTQMIVPTAVVVNATPVSPSATYGTISVVTGGYEKLYSQNYIFTVPVCATTASKQRVSGYLMNNTANWDTAYTMASQLAVIPVDGKVHAFAQAKIKGNVLGVADVDCETGVYPEKGIEPKEYAQLEDGFLIFNNTYPSTRGLAGFVHIQSPNGNIILLSDQLKAGKALPGIRIEDGKRIAASDANTFLGRYGIVNE